MPTTVVTVIPLGTIDLKAFCSCGDPCSACCDVAGCSPCAAIPRKIFATFSVVGGCPQLDGQSFELDYDSGSNTWIGPNQDCGAGDGTSLFANFSCDLFQIAVCSVGRNPDSGTCVPFNFVFTLDLSGASVCCPSCNGTYTVTLTA